MDKMVESAILHQMSARYKVSKTTPPSVSDMPMVTATQLKSETSDVFDLVVREGAVAVYRHEKPRGVLLSIEQYEALVGPELDWLAEITRECRAMFDAMQSPEQKAAALRLFEATPEELGEAAVRGAQRRIAAGEIIP
jgi:PHD/YefM family antitoxin component YafN of YafNO toxin-antitoxin module